MFLQVNYRCKKFVLGKPESWDINDAIEHWGASAALFAFASNSRVSAQKAKQLLGWQSQQIGSIPILREYLILIGKRYLQSP
jgi:hypothetical protein